MKTAIRHKSRVVTLSWLLLCAWVAYSALMLWSIKINTVGAAPMCHSVSQDGETEMKVNKNF